ncbi:MAG: IS110 family transposase [Leptospirales bacterium]
MKHFVGIDNSNTAHSVYIIDETGKKVKEFEITNNLPGFKNLELLLSGFSNATIGFELSYGPLVDYLRETAYKIISINPLKIKRYKESNLVSGNKTDSIDAHAIASYLRLNENSLKQMVFSSMEVETLKLLGVSHDRLTKEQTKYINKLTAIFRQYFPLYDGLFTSTSAVTLLKMVIKYPKWADLKSETKDDLRDFFILS